MAESFLDPPFGETGLQAAPSFMDRLAQLLTSREAQLAFRQAALDVPIAGGVRGPPKMSWELAAKKIGEGLRGIVPDEEVVRKLNAIIGGRMQYGLRTEAAVEPSYRASWSNAGTEWVPGRGYGVYKKGQEVQLDANEILIPKSWVGNMKHFEESLRFADPLPLYKGSTEAWTRGQARPGDFLQFPNRGTGWPGLGPERELP